jgi:acetyltransferase
MTHVESLEGAAAHRLVPALSRLLQHVVHGGASIGFLAPLPLENAERYWQKVLHEVHEQSRLLLAVREGDEVVGTVQLALAQPQNGRHRAEVQKLFVHPARRGRGIAKALLAALEGHACQAGRTLLVLDTASDDAAGLYTRSGYLRAGVIPQYARSPIGVLESTQIFYRLLP